MSSYFSYKGDELPHQGSADPGTLRVAFDSSAVSDSGRLTEGEKVLGLEVHLWQGREGTWIELILILSSE